MHATTGAFAAVPDNAWTTSDGVSFRELAAFAEDLLCQIAADRLGDPNLIMELAAKVAGLTAQLRNLAGSEKAVEAIIDAVRIYERTRRPGRRGHLRSLLGPLTGPGRQPQRSGRHSAAA